jgi:tRNA threonylcarbamoyladenosine biosynthesis protein TsaB
MKILALDTSTATASLAVCDDGAVLAEAGLEIGRRRGERLAQAIAFLLETVGLKPADLQAYTVGLGPGSFSGLRGGLALMKGLALAHPRPLVGVSSLEALAASAVGFRGLVLPVLDAHQGEVYAAVFEVGDAGLPERRTPDLALSPQRLRELAAGPVLILGEGLKKHGPAIAAALPAAWLAPPLCWPPRAAWVAALAAPRLARGEEDPLDPLVPLYVRSSDAELRLGPRR